MCKHLQFREAQENIYRDGRWRGLKHLKTLWSIDRTVNYQKKTNGKNVMIKLLNCYQSNECQKITLAQVFRTSVSSKTFILTLVYRLLITKEVKANKLQLSFSFPYTTSSGLSFWQSRDLVFSAKIFLNCYSDLFVFDSIDIFSLLALQLDSFTYVKQWFKGLWEGQSAKRCGKSGTVRLHFIFNWVLDCYLSYEAGFGFKEYLWVELIATE